MNLNDVTDTEQPHLLGNDGKASVEPASEQDIAEVLKYADENNKTVSVISGGTKRGFGGAVKELDILLSLKKYRGIIEHVPGDMTVTVKAGTPIKELQDFLAEYNQMLPLDPSWPEEATIGGVISANSSGPKRLKYGSARDHVIGLRVVRSDGTIIRTGGKVVKNVAGYDMNKLFVGAMGTLGVLTEITLKLRPTAKFESVVILSFPEKDKNEVRSFSTAFLDTFLEPVSLEFLSPAVTDKLTGRPDYALAIAFEDVQSSVEYQLNWMKQNHPEEAEITVLEKDKAQDFWERFSRIAPSGTDDPAESQQWAAVKIGSKSIDVFDIVQELHSLNSSELQLLAHGGAGHGLSYAYIKAKEGVLDQTVEKIRLTAEKRGGYAVARHLPLSLRNEKTVWGQKTSPIFLMDGLKKKMDPKRLINPKRFAGGI
ncbi:FAD-binding oxidoreductase [Alteribacillus sp. HJP-4]|uniref:FAD-binding oxidoreductase n=1 Tax=Alteribacillus sp. HJP-4 TaxID=2775394 RepID=UPI0035CD2895